MMHKAGIIGLGAVGRRGLANMTAHADFEVVAAWDPSAEASAAAVADVPGLVLAADAQAVIDGGAEFVYIATPPLFHHDYVVATLEAGKAIFCEKPLGIDVAESRALTERVEASGLKSAINFVFGSAPGAVELAGKLGAGGFVREVLSHFIFLVERLLGPARIAGASVRYPGGEAAETAITARLDCGGTQVTVAGSVGGRGPDRVEFTIWGERRSYRMSDWYWLAVSDGGDWIDQLADIADPRAAAYMGQLDNLAAMLDGGAHTMPSFREALRVQELIEKRRVPSGTIRYFFVNQTMRQYIILRQALARGLM